MTLTLTFSTALGIEGLVTLMNPFPGIVGDFNGDGNPDVVVFPYLIDPYLDPAIQILYGNGDGTFSPTYVNYPLYKPYVPEFAADLNSDGLSDLVELDNYNPSFNVVNSTAAEALEGLPSCSLRPTR
jgi:FG-GAP-like repeat